VAARRAAGGRWSGCRRRKLARCSLPSSLNCSDCRNCRCRRAG
jgi:hypothetical protein